MEIKIFENEEFGRIRTLKDKSGKVVVCGSDIAKALGYKNLSDALVRHCKGIVKHDTHKNGGVQAVSYITEGDVSDLLLIADCREQRSLSHGFLMRYFQLSGAPEAMLPTRICSSRITSPFWKSRIKIFSVFR